MSIDDLNFELDLLELELETEAQAEDIFGTEDMQSGVEDPFHDSEAALKPNCETYVPALKRVIELSKLNPELRRCLCFHICRKGDNPGAACSRFESLVSGVRRILGLCPKYRQSFCRALCG
jgi:hypothetical protein